MDKITCDQINKMNYADFVGLINQWNVLPGAYTTLSKWITFGQINEKSNILQVACTTGFQSREISIVTGCKGKAFDLSEYAINSAKYNKEHYSPNINIEYFVKDGYAYETNEKFSHVIIGGCLQFFPNPQLMKVRCISFLQDGGYLLASPFYVKDNIPVELIERARQVFGITITTKRYKEIMNMYQDLEIIYEDRNEILPETKEEIESYCKATVERAVRILGLEDNSQITSAIYKRLYSIKDMSNLLRPYQMYSVLVLRYRDCVYPNRYVELF